MGLFPHGAASCGALDLSRNVWEWCLNEYEDLEKIALSGSNNRVLRGGSWSSYLVFARAAYRHDNRPGFRYNFVGLRLVRLSPIFK